MKEREIQRERHRITDLQTKREIHIERRREREREIESQIYKHRER